ncbi:MAG: glucose-6-phosphate isomerase [Pseudomonadales bacterium]|jgi:glucose-6-phosphate isomerase|nr:glucose-6-phosphate isomerase [Pseudomonadales bacterium]
MSALAVPLTHHPLWSALQTQALQFEEDGLTIAALFRADPARAERFSASAAGLFMDYSKHLLTPDILEHLLQLAEAAQLPAAIAAMFNGERINNTENRPALHVALRNGRADSAEERQVQDTLARMERFVAAVQGGEWRGHDGRAIRNVVNLGIGGSDLGPAMAYAALGAFHHDALRCHFVSNVDPLHLETTLATLEPSTTLFVIASKTFTTLETLLNAQAARQWLLQGGVPEAQLWRHGAAVSANVAKAVAFGIAPENVFPLWDGVGGRYSLWSAIGLPLALGTSMAHFRALHAGAHALDEHFRNAPLPRNLPVLLALLALWYGNFWGAQTQVVLPYAQPLLLFPAFLQQLDMESLGKQVRKDGAYLDTQSGAIVWGSAGTNGQHSFHQLLHQGTHLIPADFIAVAQSSSANHDMHRQLLANCFAQSQALMHGKTLEQAEVELLQQGLSPEQARALAPHKMIAGNRPSTTLVLDALTPQSLGALVALYEHKVFAQSVLLGINAFDQWGVELGKALSTGIHAALSAPEPSTHFDASTNALINRVKRE